MPVITLTTDWGTTDYFAGALKGDILTACPGATLIDISHSVIQYDLVHGAFIFKNSWQRFPAGSVHLVGVSSGSDFTPEMIAIKYMGHFFLGNNDGFFSLVFNEIPGEMFYVLDAKGKKVTSSSTIMASSAAFLATGGKVEAMGSRVDNYIEKSMIQAVTEEKTIRGTVIYIDAFGNLVTNIERDLFDRIARGRPFDIVLRLREYNISEISENYFQAGRGNLLALYNDSGYLEISISSGNAAGLIGMKCGDIVRVEFK
jgi:S-adenosyl-L-methionine hydrolase (adenosine-forming)